MLFDDLKDHEWALLAPLFADEPERVERRGRPRVQPRDVMNAVLWILTTGESWSRLPGRYPSAPTCRRRFDRWQDDGTLLAVVARLAATGRRLSAPPKVVRARPDAQVRERLRGAFWANPSSWEAR